MTRQGAAQALHGRQGMKRILRVSVAASLTAILISCSAAHPTDGGLPPSPESSLATTLSELRFVVIGDTRPANPDDTAGYPSAIIGGIYRDIAALTPRPAFAIATGDYMFATQPGTAAAQLRLYRQASSAFSGPLFAAMGNHECNGYTDSLCGPGAPQGEPENYQQFMAQMVTPLGQTRPYYTVPLAADDGSWTAKIVVTAANAWGADQVAWLMQTLEQPTTYTFVVRHEPSEDRSRLASIGEIDQLIAGKPYTLLLCGHRHTFEHSAESYRELIVGNGGAPQQRSDPHYGYALVERRADGNLVVTELEYASNQPTGLTFAITPEGQPTG
jgi:hypothetical protein